ncbi:MAG: phosphatidylcholine/phosphatidylserine synthase [Gammaproteobacteria bacterium]|nr:MAG: phosphatidylcholine/phosphatidylserine synthase [Gammaproteobacteria bacterium]UCH39100.1 MAG: phosphatidylcholine/phosphatidylserine synthase [Gammaproteobacteria bacterium]
MDDANPKEARKKMRRGIYLLPNLFTTGALFAGFYAIIAAMNGRFEIAAIAIFLAGLLDGLDGRVARLTNTQSAFGAEYDSLSDMVSFGIAPALIVYLWSLVYLREVSNLMGKLGWLAAFIYATATALRLARFNTQIGVADKRYFQGLASPAAAAVVMGAVWVCESYEIAGQDVTYAALILTVAAGTLMVSRFSYYSFKDFDLRKRVPFVAVLAMVLVFVFLSIETATVLFTFFFLYMLSGPLVSLFRWNRKRLRLTAEPGEEKSAISADEKPSSD